MPSSDETWLFSLPIFTNSSKRVAYRMFLRSVVKILKKGVAQPQENENFHLQTDFDQNLWQGCLRHVPDGADEKLRKRGRTAPKMGIFSFFKPRELYHFCLPTDFDQI